MLTQTLRQLHTHSILDDIIRVCSLLEQLKSIEMRMKLARNFVSKAQVWVVANLVGVFGGQQGFGASIS